MNTLTSPFTPEMEEWIGEVRRVHNDLGRRRLPDDLDRHMNAPLPPAPLLMPAWATSQRLQMDLSDWPFLWMEWTRIEPEQEGVKITTAQTVYVVVEDHPLNTAGLYMEEPQVYLEPSDSSGMTPPQLRIAVEILTDLANRLGA